MLCGPWTLSEEQLPGSFLPWSEDRRPWTFAAAQPTMHLHRKGYGARGGLCTMV